MMDLMGRFNDGYIYKDRIARADEGRAVSAFYALHYTHSDENAWRQRIETGRIRLNGRPAAPDETLTRGDRLEYHRLSWEEPDAPMNYQILFQDENVVVLAKPSGLPVLPGGNFLENTLLSLVRRRFGPVCSPLHRLGRGTSGAILFTLNAPAARFLVTAMEERRICKVYLALASETSMPDAFTVDAPIGPVPHGPTNNVHAYSPNGRPSISHVRVIRRLPRKNASLLEVTIPTGRPHQIRIHLAYAGYPLVGDPLYRIGGIPRDDHKSGESAARPGDCGYLLHSWKIRFPNPAGGEDRDVVCPPPAILDPSLDAAKMS
jgi:23S rRNA pseudouridine1911/1915/1917 synthase